MDQFFVATKPCPFCGSADTKTEIVWNLGRSYVVCNQCLAQGPLVIIGGTHLYGAQERNRMAQEAWNHRKSE